MKCQQFTLLGGVMIYVPVFKVSPWVKLGYPELSTVEETNTYIMSKIGDKIAEAIKDSVRGKLNRAYARSAVKKALNEIGYWPNPKLQDKERDKRSDSWINAIETSEKGHLSCLF
jgi:DNA helicase IV